MLKLLVVEDHALVREGLLVTLKNLGMEIQGFGAANASEAIGVLEAEDIDMVILDLMLPGTQGQALLPIVRRRFPAVPVVILSALDDAATVASVMRDGASGFVGKSASSTELLEALRIVLSGATYVPPNMADLTKRLGKARGKEKLLGGRFGLTEGQSRVLELLAEGCSNRNISELLGVTEGTVKIHVSAIMKAMGVRNRSQAALMANRRPLRF